MDRQNRSADSDEGLVLSPSSVPLVHDSSDDSNGNVVANDNSEAANLVPVPPNNHLLDDSTHDTEEVVVIPDEGSDLPVPSDDSDPPANHSSSEYESTESDSEEEGEGIPIWRLRQPIHMEAK